MLATDRASFTTDAGDSIDVGRMERNARLVGLVINGYPTVLTKADIRTLIIHLQTFAKE